MVLQSCHDRPTILSRTRRPRLCTAPPFARCYYGDAKRDAAMDTLYARFVRPAISPSTSAPTSATASAVSPLGARVVALNRSRCAQCPGHLRGDRECDAGGSACGAHPAADARITRPTHGIHGPPISFARPMAPRLGRQVWDQTMRCRLQLSMRLSPSMACRISPRSTWRASRTRAGGLSRPCPSFLRVHHDPARRRVALPRSVASLALRLTLRSARARC